MAKFGSQIAEFLIILFNKNMGLIVRVNDCQFKYAG